MPRASLTREGAGHMRGKMTSVAGEGEVLLKEGRLDEELVGPLGECHDGASVRLGWRGIGDIDEALARRCAEGFAPEEPQRDQPLAHDHLHVIGIAAAERRLRRVQPAPNGKTQPAQTDRIHVNAECLLQANGKTRYTVVEHSDLQPNVIFIEGEAG
jgi:hypothetical protein